MKLIDFEELEFFHNSIIERTGGSKGIRDKDLLESAINNPFQTFDNKIYIKAH
jgi:death-on-curing protein